MKLFQEGHGKRLPTIRIQKIVLQNFKSVKQGEVLFDCGRKHIPQGTQSDILGLYGQNGSGKTSLIEALSVLKYALLGAGIPDSYVSCIAHDSKFSKLEFSFDLQYEDGRIRKVKYTFCLDSMKNEKAKQKGPVDSFEEYIGNLMDPDDTIHIYNECVQMGGDFYGEKIKLQPIIDTSPTDIKNPFIPSSKRKWFISEESEETLMNHTINKRMASKSAQSFIFMKETFAEFSKADIQSEYFEVLKELHWYARYYLFVIDTKLMGSISTNIALPLYTNSLSSYYNLCTSLIDDEDTSQEELEKINQYITESGMPNILPMSGSFIVSDKACRTLNKQFDNMNVVIEQLIPGMNISMKLLSETLTKTGDKGSVVELITIRDGVEMPLRYESDGVKKIISVLDLIIRAYNQKSTTIAIDEFDSGIFEYLLGEILESFQENGRGQFIFTSHNLRPLEVIDKKFLYFTTANPNNRYVKLKNIGKTNNLRNVYYREIVLGAQDEELYRRTHQYKIAAAFRKAGNPDV